MITRLAAVAACALLAAGCGGRTAADPATTVVDPATSTAAAIAATTPPLDFAPNPPPAGTTVCDRFGTPVAAGSVAADAVTEASGIVASRAHPGVYWLHNDSGGDAAVYAVDETGAALGTWVLDGVTPLDWEDIAIGPGPAPGVDYLYVGDIGDNLRFRPDVIVYRFPEPDPNTSGAATDVVPLRLAYPDGPADVEAMAVDPITGDLIVVTKTDSGQPTVLRAGATSIGSEPIIPALAVATLDLERGTFVTGADFSPDGTMIALRGYDEVWMWARIDLDLVAAFDAPPCLAASPEEVQGEALTFTADGSAYVTVSEGTAPTLWRVGGE